VPFDEDVWELYDMTTDFGHATDLAAEHPEKLAELQALFDREARKYNVYPLADNVLALQVHRGASWILSGVGIVGA
jgi:arylsulfatase A-like enzyme